MPHTVTFQRSISNEHKSNENADILPLIGQLNPDLVQINSLEAAYSCLVDPNKLSKHVGVLKSFNAYLESFESQQKVKQDLIQFNGSDSADPDLTLTLSVFYRCFNQDALFSLILTGLTEFLNELFETGCKPADQVANFKKIETLFIDLNADLVCCKFLSPQVLRFFNLTFTLQTYSQQLKHNECGLFHNNPMNLKYKLECVLLSRLSSFTYELIYKLCTSYYLRDGEEVVSCDKIFQELVEFVEKSLDSPFGIQGFCDFYACHSSTTETCTDKTQLIETAHNKFLVLLSTASKPRATKEYFIKCISLLNKLFRINYTYCQSGFFSSLQSRLGSVLAQLNQLAELDADYLQNWLAKLFRPSDEAQTSSERSILKQLALYLASDKNNLVDEVVTLSVLSSFINAANKLVDVSNSVNFPELIALMNTLCCAGTGRGHLYLFQACCIWLEYFGGLDMDALVGPEGGDKLKSASHVLSYVCDILSSLKATSQHGSLVGQYFNLIDPTVPKELSKLFQKSLTLDFNEDFARLVEYLEANEEKNLNQKSDKANDMCSLAKLDKRRGGVKRSVKPGKKKSFNGVDYMDSIDNEFEKKNDSFFDNEDEAVNDENDQQQNEENLNRNEGADAVNDSNYEQYDYTEDDEEDDEDEDQHRDNLEDYDNTDNLRNENEEDENTKNGDDDDEDDDDEDDDDDDDDMPFHSQFLQEPSSEQTEASGPAVALITNNIQPLQANPSQTSNSSFNL